MKDIGDPDELDDETFRRMFMGGMASDSIDEECQSSHDDDEMSGDFTSLETPQNGEIDRSLKRFSIDGSHLRLTQDFDNLPNRKPMLPEHIDFTKRITGKYDNISMGDVSNRLAPKEENNDQANDVTQEQQEPVSNDEDIFAKIMERRRRELGMEPFTPPKFQQDNEIIKPDATEIDLETLILADAISKPAYSRKRK